MTVASSRLLSPLLFPPVNRICEQKTLSPLSPLPLRPSFSISALHSRHQNRVVGSPLPRSGEPDVNVKAKFPSAGPSAPVAFEERPRSPYMSTGVSPPAANVFCFLLETGLEKDVILFPCKFEFCFTPVLLEIDYFLNGQW